MCRGVLPWWGVETLENGVHKLNEKLQPLVGGW